MSDRPLRVVHLTVQRALSSGVRKQLRYEVKGARELDGVEWSTLAVHTGPIETPHEQPIPAPFRGLLLRWLYGWRVALRLSREHDYVLMRHMAFDPFVYLFAPFIPNRISVHHAKEIEELPLISPGTSGRIAAFVERFSGKFAVRRTVGVLGVTTELGLYERDLRAPGKPCSSYPNGIDSEVLGLAEDYRVAGEIHAVFICGTFSAWHGLDRLTEAVGNAASLPDGLNIHLIGKLSDGLRASLEALGERKSVFTVHGFLQGDQYRELMARADIGIGSLAMDRQNLREGATLKVRELLAMGIPVYSGHMDTAVPAGFPYYRVELPIRLEGLLDLARTMNTVSRAQVREQSLPYIEKVAGMKNVVAWLRSLAASNHPAKEQ